MLCSPCFLDESQQKYTSSLSGSTFQVFPPKNVQKHVHLSNEKPKTQITCHILARTARTQGVEGPFIQDHSHRRHIWVDVPIVIRREDRIWSDDVLGAALGVELNILRNGAEHLTVRPDKSCNPFL